MTTELAKGLITIARKLGRWIIEHLAQRGVSMLIGYMRGKIDDFGRRLAKAKTDRRRTWLRGRIRRWTAAVQWLSDRDLVLSRCAGAEFDALSKGAAKKIPMICEKAVT